MSVKSSLYYSTKTEIHIYQDTMTDWYYIDCDDEEPQRVTEKFAKRLTKALKLIDKGE